MHPNGTPLKRSLLSFLKRPGDPVEVESSTRQVDVIFQAPSKNAGGSPSKPIMQAYNLIRENHCAQAWVKRGKRWIYSPEDEGKMSALGAPRRKYPEYCATSRYEEIKCKTKSPLVRTGQ